VQTFGGGRGSFTVPKADDTAQSGTVAEEVEDGGWRVEVEDDQRKLGWWLECVVGPNC
jgi:hypothetical protein